MPRRTVVFKPEEQSSEPEKSEVEKTAATKSEKEETKGRKSAKITRTKMAVGEEEKSEGKVKVEKPAQLENPILSGYASLIEVILGLALVSFGAIWLIFQHVAPLVEAYKSLITVFFGSLLLIDGYWRFKILLRDLIARLSQT